MSANDLETVLDELGETMRAVDPGGLRALEERLVAARRVFVAGAGRSGLVVRAFAMRLMHLGLHAHVVGSDAGASSPWAPSSNRRCCSCSTLS